MHKQTLTLAAELCRELLPYVTRIQIAGSLRRGVEDAHDIDLVCLPTAELYDLLDTWLENGTVRKRLKSNGSSPIAWGPRFRAMIWEDQAVDLYMTAPQRWGYRLLLSTGDADCNKLIVTPSYMGGLLPNTVNLKDDSLVFSQESDVFKLVNIPYIQANLRTPNLYKFWASHDIAGLYDAVLQSNGNDLYTVYVDHKKSRLDIYDRSNGKLLKLPKHVLDVLWGERFGRSTHHTNWISNGCVIDDSLVYTPGGFPISMRTLLKG